LYNSIVETSIPSRPGQFELFKKQEMNIRVSEIDESNAGRWGREVSLGVEEQKKLVREFETYWKMSLMSSSLEEELLEDEPRLPGTIPERAILLLRRIREPVC